MTYRLDSDIVVLQPYGRLRCIRPDSSTGSCRDYPHIGRGKKKKKEEIKRAVDNYPMYRNKNRTVAWFVSNCQTESRRELLVRNLSLFIPVDIFGSCSDDNKWCGWNRTECDAILNYYHFYLSLENSLCPDYVTEKLYRALAHHAIPVVYGGANYSRFLPAGSYVNAVDFASPQELAKRLDKILNENELYESFFRWKKEYRVDMTPFDGWCRLCRLLNSKKNTPKSYQDIAAWWSGYKTNQSCFNPPVSLVGDDQSSTKTFYGSSVYKLFQQFLIPQFRFR